MAKAKRRNDGAQALSRSGAKAELRALAERIKVDPQTNSVFDFARGLFLALEAGETDLDRLDALTDEVGLALLVERADRFRERHADADPAAAWEPVEARLAEVATGGPAALKELIEAPQGGVVFTAHPTFALSLEAREAFAAHVEKPTPARKKALAAAARADSRDWSASISLAGEHAEVQAAIAHAQIALRAYAGRCVAAAREAMPGAWRNVRPALPTLASWVGYDLDGRTDIHWTQSVAFRLQEKATQLRRYQSRLEEMGAACTDLAARIARAADHTEAAHARFADGGDSIEALVDAANFLTADHPDKLTDASEITDALSAQIATADDETAAELAVLRAEIDALQLGTARIHLRLNAAQIRTVISRDLGLETEDRTLGRLALRQLSKRAAEEAPRAVNFVDLYREQSTARRQFMMCAQFLKHIDAGSTIRFLIAESENPATVMGALYLARQYGVDRALDISPLFETPEALETGGRFIERLLEEETFVDYLRRRGYLSVQFGFSDAGRFIGQVAADMAIERIHNLIARALARKDTSLGLLLFNTHGESMGRGAWPGDFTKRLNHVLSLWTRKQAAARGARLRHEVSFQGGDGFLHFQTPALAEATFAAFCAHILSPAPDTSGDAFYARTDFVWDFYRSLRDWQTRLFNNADYGRLLSDFATNFLVRAGSRIRRRSGGPGGPRSLRAISHNATLQQLGVPVNTAAGIGSAVRRENDRLIDLIDQSPRLSDLINLALAARMKTSVPALRGYANVYAPDLWVALARRSDPEPATAYRRVYYALREAGTAQSLRQIANVFSIDLGKFDALIAQLRDARSSAERHEARLDIHVLHGVRQALMMKALALGGAVPILSERHGTSARDIMAMIAQMRISDAVALLCEVFPKSDAAPDALSRIEEPGCGGASAAPQGYDQIHADIIAPLDRIDAMLHKITLNLASAYDAYG